MAFAVVYVLYALAAYIAYFFIDLWLGYWRVHRFAKHHGCEEPQRNTLTKWPWGLDGMYRMLKAVSEGKDILDDLVIARYKKLNATTIVGTGLFGAQITDTIDPQNLQAILATNFKDFGTGERRRKQFGPLLGYNIFTSDGEFWAHSRAMIRPLFNREQINDLEQTDRASKILIDVLPQATDGWTEKVELMEYFYRFTLDTATAFLVGQTTDSQLAHAGRLISEKGSVTEMATNQDFVQSLTTAQEWLSWRIRMQGLYRLIYSRKWAKAAENVRTFVNHYVQMALDQQAEEQKLGKPVDNGKKYNLLRELARECQDPIELRDQLLGVLIAGRDTTATLLSYLFIELARRPDIYAKLRQQVLEDFGDASSDLSRLSFSKLKSCRYLQHVILETLRLYPAVPFNNRQANRDTTLPVGGGPLHDKPIAIGKGQIVTFSVYALQRRKDLWGEDADDFKPERWNGRKIGWDFLPFSGGPRICLGQQYAMTEASFLTVRLLQTYDYMEWLGSSGKIKKGFGLIMYPADGVPVRLHRAA